MGAVPAVGKAGRCKRGLAGDAVPAFARAALARRPGAHVPAPAGTLRGGCPAGVPAARGAPPVYRGTTAAAGSGQLSPEQEGLPGRKDGAEAKSFIHRKRGVHRFGCTPLRFCCVTGSDPLHTALWACFRPPERLRAQPSGRVLLPRGCRPASRSTSWRSPGTGRS